MTHSMQQKLTTEFIGTFFLSLTICTAVVYGSAEAYAPFGIASTLMVMIYAGGHISGAHYNPAVTVSIYLRGACDKDEVLPYIASQVVAAVSAAIVAELLFTFALAYVILNVATTESTSGNGYYGAAIALVVLAGAITVGSISLASFNPAVTSALIVSGKLTIADSWMHFVPQFVGAVLATYVYKSTQ